MGFLSIDAWSRIVIIVTGMLVRGRSTQMAGESRWQFSSLTY